MGYDLPAWSLDVVRTMMALVKMKDQDTFDHCVRVSKLSRMLAEASGLSSDDARIVEYAGLFHDIGKVGVPDGILLKPAKLTDVEYEVMKSHPVLSVEALQPLSQVAFFGATLPGVRHHHERFDGKGYPVGVKGEEIPLAARMILVVDTFDAMTFSRPYRKGLPPEVAYKELVDFAGRQFDPKLVEIFNEVHPKLRLGPPRNSEELNPILDFSNPKASARAA